MSRFVPLRHELLPIFHEFLEDRLNVVNGHFGQKPPPSEWSLDLVEGLCTIDLVFRFFVEKFIGCCPPARAF